MRSWFAGMLLSLLASPAAAAEPLVVDPWLEPVPPPSRAVASFEPVIEIVDPWAGSAAVALYETEEIIDPWASHRPKIPTAAFPLIE